MDHDDTDFQSQNFQLAGEDNSKFSSGLRPFAVPKLDIDDQLQNHLRFDSLVDSEAFFSVQGHDSSWIEALSTGSSIVDFSSSAAESCSISKANNVWSEATSTESVEMLLKSVGESEMTGNMDGNAHNQLSGMESQIDPSNEQPKSSDSPTDSTVVPTEKDQSQSTCSGMTGGPECSQSTHSRMTEDPSSTQSQLDHFAPFSMDEKGIVSEKLSSSHKTLESCPAAGNYFEAVHDDRSLNRLNMPSAELGSGKLNNEPFPELAPLHNIYVTDSYHFDHVNQESEVGVPQDSKICHIKENKVEGGLLDLQNLSHTGQPVSAVNLPNQVSNEHLLPGSSDGLLEAITNPVKMLQKTDDTSKTVSGTLQPPFSPLQHTAEGMNSSAGMSNELVDKEFDIGSNSALSHQSEPNLRNSNPHHVTSLSVESSKMNLSPKRNLDIATSVPAETKNDGADGTKILSDESKHGVLGDYQNSVDNPKIGSMEQNTIREDVPEVSGNIKKMVESDHEENTTGVTGTSNDNFDSSDNIAPDNSSADSFHASEDPNIPSVNNEKLCKESDTPALEERAENTHLVLSSSESQKNISPPLISSSGNIISTPVTDTSDGSRDKNDRSEDVSVDGSSALLLVEKDSRKCKMNHEESSKKEAKSTLEDEDNIISPGSVPRVEIPAASMNPNTDAASVAKEAEFKEHTISLGGLTAEENQDKSGNHPYFYLEKCQTDESSIQSECHIDLAIPSPSTLGTSSEKAGEKAAGIPQTAKENLDAHVQDTVLSHDTDHSPATVISQGKLGSSGDGTSADATCGSPSVISCTEPSPQKGGHGSSSLVHQTLDKLSENVTDNEASADVTKSLKQCSNRNTKSTLASEETSTAGDDRSFSFEVGGSPNLSEKAHSSAWSPFPGFSASQSTEVITENPQPKSPGRPLNNSSDSKKTSSVEAGKEPLPERKVTESSAGPSDNSNNGDRTKSSPLASRQHSTPECSVSSADLVNLPFTDAQHLQLRAQIFVYGALIQGTPPGEAYMVAAFGEAVSDGKTTWEAAWRAALERFQFQKSIYTSLETPTSSRIGTVSEKATKGTAVKTAPGSKKGGKTVLPAHSAVALHSPSAPASTSTFNLQRGTHLDFSQAVSPVFAYNSHMRHPSSGVASLHPSPGPRPSSWLVQPQNLIFDSSMQPAVPTNETSKGQSSQSISISHAVSPGIFAPSPAPPVVAPLAVIHEEKQKAPTSTSKGTSSQKPRKRKKASASPEQQPVVASPQLSTDMVSFTPAAKHTAGFTLSTHSPSNALGSRLVPNTGQITSLPSYQITGGMDAEQRNIFSEQILGAIEQSTGQAKGASLHSMEAVRHKESVWSHLSTISRNNLPPEVEEKLTSAAAAAEAAVSVAKAAAEAAKMASEASLQAKMMAEEALNSYKSVNSLQNLEAGQFNVNINPSLLSSSPASSWKIKDNSHAPGSIVSAAREVARKRVEEASAAAKRAENLDAILKAAELAAEAVFNAGTIIGMGEPLPFTLSELLEAGPNGFWKSERVKNINSGNGNGNPVTETLQVDVPADFSKSGKKRGRKPKSAQSVLNLEPSSSARELQPDGMQSGHGVNDVPAITSVDGKSNDTALTSIEKGSVVEVSSDAGGFGVAWFPAKVVDINEGGALISYDNHNEGTGPREEWVPLKLEGDKAPRIRLAHPTTLSKFKTRKRRREPAGNCSWVVGDHVDAWVDNRWREGVIAQNHQADETKFVVQFSAGGVGDSFVVDAWSLRPSLIWKDGQWTDWSRARDGKSKFNKGDSPLEKRQRTDPLPVGDKPFGGEAGGPSKDKSSINSKKPEELKPLALSQRDVIFNVGKSVVENKTDALAFKRPGLQKEGSKVVYGVPKHGRRKKFMEVSKHYVAGQSDKISEGNASSRVPRHTVPPLPRPRDNTSKIDQRGRRVGEVRSRGPPKPSKSQSAAANTILDKDSLSMPVPNSGVFGRNFGFTGSTSSTSNTEKSTVEKNNVLLGTVPRIEDPSVSEVQAVSSIPTSNQDLPATNRTKRKHVSSVDNRSIRKTSERTSSDAAEPQRTSSDSAEPRRSNRRIQPTSRLLEGLQSSLIVSKVPGEKGPRSNFRSTTSRGRAHG